MTEKVISFDINAASRSAGAPSPLRPAPADRPSKPRAPNRALARAQLASVYAGLVGQDIAVADILENLQMVAGAGHLGLTELCAALRGCGLTTGVENTPRL